MKAATFYCKKSPFIHVWSEADGKVIARFNNGTLETSDESLINKLEALGYESDIVKTKAETKVETKTEIKSPDIDELKAKADELGIKYSYNTGVKKLLEKITKAEGDGNV